ncbi:MAG: DHHA1 domain-containing protein [Chloroflexaceae bacterium]|jgi:alanyl-tRNA synthetase|nr:DHHA1 domain-containing protein [Chloroflexaceae bacterium]
MTQRLYFTDSYQRRFQGRVVEQGQWQGQPAVALDQSAFYPEGGGQPADHGMLGGVPVVDVQLREGLVWHVLGQPAELPDEVEGEIDWARRFDHMQQHLGQHLLTAAFVATANLATVSFHMGAQRVTIDLDTPTLTAEQVHAAETLANEIIWEDRPVSARFVSAEELATLPLRKPPTVDGPVRVVSVPGFDYSACGGTHPRSTGGVGLVAVTGWTRQKGGTRVEFVCGGRALHEQRRLSGITTAAAGLLSVGSDELVAALQRLQAANAAMYQQLERLQAQLLAAEVERFYTSASAIGTARVVCHLLEAENMATVRNLAQQIAERPSGLAILGLADGERGQLVIACHPDTGLDARVLLQMGLATVQGRGGGSATLAQGGGFPIGALPSVLETMLALVREKMTR